MQHTEQSEERLIRDSKGNRQVIIPPTGADLLRKCDDQSGGRCPRPIKEPHPAHIIQAAAVMPRVCETPTTVTVTATCSGTSGRHCVEHTTAPHPTPQVYQTSQPQFPRCTHTSQQLLLAALGIASRIGLVRCTGLCWSRTRALHPRRWRLHRGSPALPCPPTTCTPCC